MTRNPDGDSRTSLQKQIDQTLSNVEDKLKIVEENQNKLIADLEECNKDKLGLVEVIHDLERQLARCEKRNPLNISITDYGGIDYD